VGASPGGDVVSGGDVLGSLRAGIARRSAPTAIGVSSLGMVLHDSAPTLIDPDTEQTTAYVASEAPDRARDCAERAVERLAAVRPALAALRNALRDRRTAGAQRAVVIEATANASRHLAHARRSVRALVSELSDLETEARELVALAYASTLPDGSRP